MSEKLEIVKAYDTGRGHIVVGIPKRLRTTYGFHKHDHFYVMVEDGRLVYTPVTPPENLAPVQG